MSPPPSQHRKSPPATAVPPQSRNGHAQTLSPGAGTHSRHLQRGRARPPAADHSRSDRSTTPYAGRCHLGKSNLRLLLFL
jgi:hypothetical protein